MVSKNSLQHWHEAAHKMLEVLALSEEGDCRGEQRRRMMDFSLMLCFGSTPSWIVRHVTPPFSMLMCSPTSVAQLLACIGQETFFNFASILHLTNDTSAHSHHDGMPRNRHHTCTRERCSMQQQVQNLAAANCTVSQIHCGLIPKPNAGKRVRGAHNMNDVALPQPCLCPVDQQGLLQWGRSLQHTRQHQSE